MLLLCVVPLEKGLKWSKPNIINCWKAVVILYKWAIPILHSTLNDVIFPTGKQISKDIHRSKGIQSVYRYLIEKLSTKESLIVDPLACSGDVLLEAMKLGRRAVGVEPREARYHAARRALAELMRQAEKEEVAALKQ